MEQVIFRDLGRIAYREAWDCQEQLLRELVDRKRANRQRRAEGQAEAPQRHYLLFCEHDPVYTLGKSGSAEHLLLDEAALTKAGFEFYKINRGGDITYHGPGQIVGYPIFDLDCFFTDVHRYVRTLEEAVIRTLADFGLVAGRMEGYTGVWLEQTNQRPKRKICAIGVHLSRWVTMHGFAFNVQPNLQHFRNIVPCGIAEPDKDVTSLERELDRPVDIGAVKERLKNHFAELFGFEWAPLPSSRINP
jgi:lipoyl(octanoyl) transferase